MILHAGVPLLTSRAGPVTRIRVPLNVEGPLTPQESDIPRYSIPNNSVSSESTWALVTWHSRSLQRFKHIMADVELKITEHDEAGNLTAMYVTSGVQHRQAVRVDIVVRTLPGGNMLRFVS